MKDKTTLRALVKTYYDLQHGVTRLGNRCKVKKNGEDQIVPDNQADGYRMDVGVREYLMDLRNELQKSMDETEKRIKTELKKFPVYTEYLVGVKGVGPLMSAVIIAEYDIEKATTVSKMWRYTGLDPSETRGVKVVKTTKPKTYEPKDGEVIRKFDDHVWVRTNTMVRADRLTPGFRCPFNKDLRTKMVGVLGSQFIKAKAPYATEFYYPHKLRLEQEHGWEDESKGHRHRAAIRYMIKMFLADLYAAWRELEGLPVRKPYQEEYLGHTHAA